MQLEEQTTLHKVSLLPKPTNTYTSILLCLPVPPLYA